MRTQQAARGTACRRCSDTENALECNGHPAGLERFAADVATAAYAASAVVHTTGRSRRRDPRHHEKEEKGCSLGGRKQAGWHLASPGKGF